MVERDELRKNSVCVSNKGNAWVLTKKILPGTSLILDAPLAPDFAIEFIQKVGISAREKISGGGWLSSSWACWFEY